MINGFTNSIRALWIILSLLLVSGLPGCKSTEIAGHFTENPIAIDGQIADWDGIPATFFEDQGALLGIANDSLNLYMYLRVRDPIWARSIKMTGLTIWLDAHGKKSKDVSIRYIGGISKSEMKDAMGQEAARVMPPMGQDQKERIEEMMSGEDQFTFIDDSRWYLPKDLDLEGANGPAVAYASVEGFFNYEFRVPLAECSGSFYGLGAKPADVLGIGAEWGDPGVKKRPSGMPGGGMRGGGMPPGGGMGGGGGGGMRPGGPPGGQPPDRHEKQEIWLKTALAVADPK